MISNGAAVIFLITSLLLSIYLFWAAFTRKRMMLIHKLYISICAVFLVWCIAMLGMWACPMEDLKALWVWDCLTYVGVAFAPAIMLLITVVFVTGAEKMPPALWMILLPPLVTNIVVWTNPFHHLQYQVFHVLRPNIVFGPWVIISGAYTWALLFISAVIIIRFAMRNHSSLYRMQSTLFAIGELVPLLVSVLATSGLVSLSIEATPLSFIVTIICQFFAIYRLHVLDVEPIATQHVLEWITDCYLIVSANELVLSHNEPFRKVFGQLYGITENKYLRDCVKEEDVAGRTAVYNLLSNLETCRQSGSGVSYEQSVTVRQPDGEVQKLYYLADITPLSINERLSGFIVFFKDITQVKKSMQQLQDSQNRMMEQERLAFLGQMVGGLAHNLKTPIMSISGCSSAVGALITEVRTSLGDPEVTLDDYHEICDEMDGWLAKMRESCSYMSDIITAIKGQAAHATVSGGTQTSFTLDDLVKRCSLLMRHELMSSGCRLETEPSLDKTLRIPGDINNLVQVVNNLITNAIDAQKKDGDHRILLGLRRGETHMHLMVKDFGSGVDPRVRSGLFKKMATSTGTKGTGLGLYISSAVVKGKFGGHMWVEDNPEGGTVFGIALPLDHLGHTEKEAQ